MDKQLFAQRRTRLVALIKEKFVQHKGSVFLFGNVLADGSQPFSQEPTFYYLTGITEPGAVFQLGLDGRTKLFIPNTGDKRKVWIKDTLACDPATAQNSGIDELVWLGDLTDNYCPTLRLSAESSSNLIATVRECVSRQEKIFTCVPVTGDRSVQQQFIVDRLSTFIPGLSAALTDISPLVASMRRLKDAREVEQMFKAVQMTIAAQYEAAQLTEPDIEESALQAGIMFLYTLFGVQPAFAAIVAAGKNSVFPHYEKSNGELAQGDVVVVDCGARCENYCADLTRTYPVSGKFSKRQREIYAAVLACQEYIADLARPGMWLNNKEKPELSLNHLARAWFAKHGYQDYVVHGIGHFVGMDVHDVGDVTQPLAEGDVITIEPGLYLPQEGFGVRIEDMYWVIKDGVHCLSEDLPRSIDAVQKMVQEKEQGCQDNCSHPCHKHD